MDKIMATIDNCLLYSIMAQMNCGIYIIMATRENCILYSIMAKRKLYYLQNYGPNEGV